MARMRVFMVFVLAVTAGGALAFGTYNYVQQQPAQDGVDSDAAGGGRRQPTSTSAPS